MNAANQDQPIAPEPTALDRLAALQTDVGNAARFVRQFGARYRYCHPWGKWMWWDGRRWVHDDRGRVQGDAKRVAIGIYREAAAETDNDAKREALVKWAERSQNRDRLSAMTDLAKSDLAISPSAFDADPWLLNCQNGTVDLRTGELHPHDRDQYLTRMCEAKYRPDANSPTFSRFLARIFQTNPTLIGYVQRSLGYACTALTREQVLFFLYGSGANGKTTLLDAVMHALGDYAGKADRELLAARDGTVHPTNVADLMGRRAVVCSETNEGGRLDEAKLKDLVGETTLKARFMRQDFFEFTATHKVFLYSNHKPYVRGTDHGFWRRIRVIPFVERITDAEKDRALGDKLKAAADAVLAWLVEGCLQWQAIGLAEPDVVGEATDGYRTEMDSIGAFLTECCEVGDDMQATAGALYQAYSRWCEDSGEKPLSQKRLGTQLSERGMSRERGGSGRYEWFGIGLRNGLQTPPS